MQTIGKFSKLAEHIPQTIRGENGFNQLSMLSGTAVVRVNRVPES